MWETPEKNGANQPTAFWGYLSLLPPHQFDLLLPQENTYEPGDYSIGLLILPYGKQPTKVVNKIIVLEKEEPTIIAPITRLEEK